MIIWLASYPKSGNTLLRSILSAYFYSEEGNFGFNNLYKISQFPAIDHFLRLGVNVDDEEEVYKNFINAQNLINEERKAKFFKTHSRLCQMYGSNFTDLKNTLGAIYVVRDPRNVVTSFAHHYSLSINDAVTVMVDKTRILENTSTTPKTFLGSWNIHYNTWKQLELNKKLLLIKYEDLIKNKKTVLIRIFKFLNTLRNNEFKIDMIKLNKVIKSTEFQKMKKLEEKYSFQESMIDKKTGKKIPFFNLGEKNDWRKILDIKIREQIETSFEKEMKELNYL